MGGNHNLEKEKSACESMKFETRMENPGMKRIATTGGGVALRQS